MNDLEREFLTVDELAGLLKVPRSWVYQRTRVRGHMQLPHIKLGKYLRFDRQIVLAWLDQQSSSSEVSNDSQVR